MQALIVKVQIMMQGSPFTPLNYNWFLYDLPKMLKIHVLCNNSEGLLFTTQIILFYQQLLIAQGFFFFSEAYGTCFAILVDNSNLTTWSNRERKKTPIVRALWLLKKSLGYD